MTSVKKRGGARMAFPCVKKVLSVKESVNSNRGARVQEVVCVVGVCRCTGVAANQI
ncbi:Uncharacterized protein DAT39_022602 [Clarias magur]|uniref:Uncharacterized protein n=1 Tax=Clarias magur TaxID=1594786 RepID=A0A8J4TU80_CLAMG|nr:Uncharacterized protein DAT39_022602 [Clarias magur]